MRLITNIANSTGSAGFKDHTANRISSYRKALYTLQGAGLCKAGLSTESASVVSSLQQYLTVGM